MQMILRSLLVMVLSISHVFAQGVTAKGMAEERYTGLGVSKSFKEEILDKAKKNALEQYVSKKGLSFVKNYDLVKSDVHDHIDKYVLSYEILDEEVNKDRKTYKIVIRADINTVNLDAKLNSTSAIANTADAEKSYISIVFVARKQGEVKSYDAKVYKRDDSTEAVEGSDFESGSRAGVEYAAQKSASKTSTTGGSQTQKADTITYTVESSQTINVAMNEIFASNNYEVVEAEYLEEGSGGLISVAAFVNDYQLGNDITSTTKQNAVKGAQMLEIHFFAMGTLDVGIKQIDASSGMTKIFVTVTGKVLDLRGRFPKTLASVGPVQFAGLGPNETVAKNNALKLAAQSAATELVQQLNSKGTY